MCGLCQQLRKYITSQALLTLNQRSPPLHLNIHLDGGVLEKNAVA